MMIDPPDIEKDSKNRRDLMLMLMKSFRALNVENENIASGYISNGRADLTGCEKAARQMDTAMIESQ